MRGRKYEKEEATHFALFYSLVPMGCGARSRLAGQRRCACVISHLSQSTRTYICGIRVHIRNSIGQLRSIKIHRGSHWVHFESPPTFICIRGIRNFKSPNTKLFHTFTRYKLFHRFTKTNKRISVPFILNTWLPVVSQALRCPTPKQP